LVLPNLRRVTLISFTSSYSSLQNSSLIIIQKILQMRDIFSK
jgi:hypothetical protein